MAGRGKEDLHEAANRAFAEIARIHELMSAHSIRGDVFQINTAPVGDVVPVDGSTWRVLELAADIADASDGAFDVTIGGAMQARGALPALTDRLPDSDATFRDLELLPGNRVRVHRALAIDLGGIAKGYAVDSAVDILKRCGVPAGCVNAGGDLRVFGAQATMVQVRDPLEPSMARAQLELYECALATSANYAPERGYSPAGVILDPRRGEVAGAGRSASVRAARCAVADALAKCVLMLGDASKALLERFAADGFLLDRQEQRCFASSMTTDHGSRLADESQLATAGRFGGGAQSGAGAVIQ